MNILDRWIYEKFFCFFPSFLSDLVCRADKFKCFKTRYYGIRNSNWYFFAFSRKKPRKNIYNLKKLSKAWQLVCNFSVRYWGAYKKSTSASLNKNSSSIWSWTTIWSFKRTKKKEFQQKIDDKKEEVKTVLSVADPSELNVSFMKEFFLFFFFVQSEVLSWTRVDFERVL